MNPCKYEETIGYMKARIKSIDEKVDDIKDNHLKHIYEKIDCIYKKLSRPSWMTATIIAFLCSLVTGLLVTIFRIIAR